MKLLGTNILCKQVDVIKSNLILPESLIKAESKVFEVHHAGVKTALKAGDKVVLQDPEIGFTVTIDGEEYKLTNDNSVYAVV